MEVRREIHIHQEGYQVTKLTTISENPKIVLVAITIDDDPIFIDCAIGYHPPSTQNNEPK